MDAIIDSLDYEMQKYVEEAQNADIKINLDLYLSKLLAEKGKDNTEKERNKILDARDELYEHRLLLHHNNSDGSGFDDVKVGLHTCMYGSELLVASWKMPLFRHYILNNNPSAEFESIVTDKRGYEHHTEYRMIVKNHVKLRFTHVVKATNMFPGMFDDETLKMLKDMKFFSDSFLDEMIEKYDPNEYDPDAASKIIADEFLQELLERRASTEFKNIVFSIQKKQGEIIQSAYKRNMVVQGCAGSGKSMIMMHRLPLVLYDNPNSIKETDLYIITPSQMYIQLAENMRRQLEISNIKMGTIEQYYDYCISKYPGHNESEYGKINYGNKIGYEKEKYVYSRDCAKDICDYYESINKINISLDKATMLLQIESKKTSNHIDTYSKKTDALLNEFVNIIETNKKVLADYYKIIQEVKESLGTLCVILRFRKNEILREVSKFINSCETDISKAEKELKKLNADRNPVAVENQNNIIANSKKRIEQLRLEEKNIEADTDYFNSLNNVSIKIYSVLEPFEKLEGEFSQNNIEDIYDAISNIGQLIGGYYMIVWEFSKLDDKYLEYLGANNTLSKAIDLTGKTVSVLQSTNKKYLEFNYFSQIEKEYNLLLNARKNAVKTAYTKIMDNIGISANEKGNIKAVSCSPYIYLQALYCFSGEPSSEKESLLAIDEAQGLAPEELRLLKNVNGNSVCFNLYGDTYQHIENTKGIDSWEEYKDFLDYDYYEMMENYRNASQITEYCNRTFGMKMMPINTPGKGVHELNSYSDFISETTSQLIGTQKAGLGAIIVSNSAEARYLLDKFEPFSQKFNDMTSDEFTVHMTRWNIINIADAKGLEFSSVIVLSGRMSEHEKYIAYTRALDDLYVYKEVIDVSEYEEKPKQLKEKPQSKTIVKKTR